MCRLVDGDEKRGINVNGGKKEVGDQYRPADVWGCFHTISRLSMVE